MTMKSGGFPLGELIAQLETRPTNDDPVSCSSFGCPAKIKYDSIFYKDEAGVMFDVGNLLVWVRAGVLSYDEDQFDLCLGRAIEKGLVS